ncbi:PEGA domain-containing protein [Caldisericum sp. AR60]|uniref:PEGA domain-containing protein n=1 Tax=Caldisericum sp. AR60 TaxID=3397852 RepID=UPI0039FC9C6E
MKRLHLLIFFILFVLPLSSVGCNIHDKTSIEITSNPEGADVYIETIQDNNIFTYGVVGKTPITTELSTRNKYRITLEKDGFMPKTQEVSLSIFNKKLEVNLREFPYVWKIDTGQVLDGKVLGNKLFLVSSSELYKIDKSAGKVEYKAGFERINPTEPSEPFGGTHVTIENGKVFIWNVAPSKALIIDAETGKAIGYFICAPGERIWNLTKSETSADKTDIELKFTKPQIYWKREIDNEYLSFIQWKDNMLLFGGIEPKEKYFQIFAIDANTGATMKVFSYPSLKGVDASKITGFLYPRFEFDPSNERIYLFPEEYSNIKIVGINLNTFKIDFTKSLNAGYHFNYLTENFVYALSDDYSELVAINKDTGEEIKLKLQPNTDIYGIIELKGKGKFIGLANEKRRDAKDTLLTLTFSYLIEINSGKSIVRFPNGSKMITSDDSKVFLYTPPNQETPGSVIAIDKNDLLTSSAP